MKHPRPHRRQRGLANRHHGFTLIELMVGMTVGLLATLAITAVMLNAENQRRTTTTGSDAQVNSSMAVYAIERQLKMAGYGLTTSGVAAGCTLTAQYGGAAVAGAPPALVPVVITQGANGAPDSLRILSSSASSFVMPIALRKPFYDPTSLGDAASRFLVETSLGVKQGDLLALVYGGADRDCEVFQASAVDTNLISRQAGNWNANGFPSKPATADSFLINLGRLRDLTFSITADLKLRQTAFDLASRSASNQDLQSNIVTLKALYGKDTNGDDVVDSYDAVVPATGADWLTVRTVRFAILSRSAQYEKDEVTAANPLWDVGTAAAVSGSAACGTSRCITLKADGQSDWKHYRYKVSEVLVPLRNMLWRSDLVAAPAPSAPASGGL